MANVAAARKMLGRLVRKAPKKASVDELKALDEAGDYAAVRKPDKKDLAEILAGSDNKGGVPVRKVKTTAVGPAKDVPKTNELKKPYVQTKTEENLIKRIFADAEQNRTPLYNFAKEPVFGPADAALTKELVPQVSIAGKLPPKPGMTDRLPANERARPILENEEAIGGKLADFMRQSPHADNPLPFYSTGSVIMGLVDKGKLSMQDALTFMRDWAGQGAGTSPRTATPTNLKNASYLQFRRESNDPLTAARQQQEREQTMHGFPTTHNIKPDQKPNLNRPGFPMMGMHTRLADQFANEGVDPWRNPKPFTFRENWLGNMADVTADTHNIRAVLDAYDQLDPGGLPRGWFKTNMAYDNYMQGGGFPADEQLDVGAINDTLSGQKIGGRDAQTEYPIIQGPTNRAAEILGISPAEAQERLWFDRGSRTGLQSPRMAIPDLLNSQIERTSDVTGMSPEDILKLWARRRIPLAENAPMNDLPGAQANA
jgi:hypothetical protein